MYCRTAYTVGAITEILKALGARTTAEPQDSIIELGPLGELNRGAVRLVDCPHRRNAAANQVTADPCDQSGGFDRAVPGLVQASVPEPRVLRVGAPTRASD